MTASGLSIANTVRVARAVATNQVARFAPSAYVRLTGQTGRGAAAEEGPADIADYFLGCADAYFERLGIATAAVPDFLAGKTLMEYGPGDLPGVAALMIARGAERVYCVDRFPLVRLSAKNVHVLTQLIQACQGRERDRILTCLVNPDDPAMGFDPRRVQYLVRPSGLSGLRDEVDLVFSRAVLEHVDDLERSFGDMVAALRPSALAIHLVDLRSHGLHMHNPLDFLTWHQTLWRWMYSHKGVPNRWRVDRYRDVVSQLPVELHLLEATKLATPEQVAEVRSALASPFNGLTDEDLRCLGFWMVLRKRKA